MAIFQSGAHEDSYRNIVVECNNNNVTVLVLSNL